MKRSTKILILLPIFASVAYVAILLINSFIIYPPAEPLKFYIVNKDNATHRITVEIMNKSGSVIFEKEYKINPSERIESPIIAKNLGTYLFRVTLDKNIVKEELVSVSSGYGPVSITIHSQERFKFLRERVSINQPVV